MPRTKRARSSELERPEPNKTDYFPLLSEKNKVSKPEITFEDTLYSKLCRLENEIGYHPFMTIEGRHKLLVSQIKYSLSNEYVSDKSLQKAIYIVGVVLARQKKPFSIDSLILKRMWPALKEYKTYPGELLESSSKSKLRFISTTETQASKTPDLRATTPEETNEVEELKEYTLHTPPGLKPNNFSQNRVTIKDALGLRSSFEAISPILSGYQPKTPLSTPKAIEPRIFSGSNSLQIAGPLLPTPSSIKTLSSTAHQTIEFMNFISENSNRLQGEILPPKFIKTNETIFCFGPGIHLPKDLTKPMEIEH